MKVLIIEDEIMARRSLEKLLQMNFSDVEVVGECGSVKEAVQWLQEKPDGADVVFMDVELSDGECFEIFRRVEVRPRVVMTTAYDSYAIKAFEAGSVDYLLKPIDPPALRRAVERCRQASGGSDAAKILGSVAAQRPSQAYKERFLVQFNDQIVPIKADEVAYFYSEDKNNHVVTLSGSVYIMDSTMDSIATELDPERFFRISRGCIIAKDVVGSVTKLIGGRLRIAPKVQLSPNLGAAPDLTVSRSRADEFLSWLER